MVMSTNAMYEVRYMTTHLLWPEPLGRPGGEEARTLAAVLGQIHTVGVECDTHTHIHTYTLT